MSIRLEILENLLDNSIADPVGIVDLPIEEKFIQLNFSKNLAVMMRNYDLGAKARHHEKDFYNQNKKDNNNYVDREYHLFDPLNELSPDEAFRNMMEAVIERGNSTPYSEAITNEFQSRVGTFLENKDLYPDLVERIKSYKFLTP